MAISTADSHVTTPRVFRENAPQNMWVFPGPRTEFLRLLSPELKTRGTGAELVSLTYRCVTVTAGRNIWVKLPVSPAAYHLIMEPTHASRSLSLIGRILIRVTSHWSIFTPPILLTCHWSHFHSGQFSSLFIGQTFLYPFLISFHGSYFHCLFCSILIGHILHIFSSH
jgi:hypothetical protein